MRIGITGSIASGKSTVAGFLRASGFPVIDADAISRSLTAPGGSALPLIREAFPDCFDGDVLNRGALGSRVFSSPEDKARLEGILHPIILSEIRAELSRLDGPGPVFADIPLLFECGMERDFDRIWVVHCAPELQLERLMGRDSLSREEAQARIQSQMSADEKMKRATDLIDTSGSPEETEKQVSDLLSRFLPRRRVRPVPVVAEPLPGTPAAEPAKAEPAKSAPPSPPKARKRKLTRQARILRLCLIALLVLLGILLTAFGTVRYLEYREERRRIEAEAAERAQHPLYYGDLVLSYSASQGLDPALVAAVILSESSFDPMAESRVGARGLMQLMEDTAAWIAHKLKEDGPSYTFDLLYDPEVNIRYGTWYLGYLSRRYDGDATKVICAYHAGQGNVDAWLRNPDYSRDGVTLDTIPTSDTAKYCSRVLRARDVYVKYYFPRPTPEPQLNPQE